MVKTQKMIVKRACKRKKGKVIYNNYFVKSTTLHKWYNEVIVLCYIPALTNMFVKIVL